MRKLALLLLVGCEEPPAPPPPKADFETLAGWTFAAGSKPPGAIRALHATRVELRGFLYPTKEVRNLRSFILMKDRGTCCFGQKAQWTHFVEVTIPPEKEAIHYTTEPVTLTGTLRVEPRFLDGAPDGLYFMSAESHRK